MTFSMQKCKEFFGQRTVKIVLVLLLGLALLLLAFRVFAPRKETSYEETAREERLSALLEKLEGVKSASVMITEEEGRAVGAVVIFEGEDTFLVRIRLAEIAAGALGIEEREIRIYAA